MTKQKIKLISHRGNLNGVNPDRENSPSYIQKAIFAGYDVEIDVRWWNDGIWLGHDTPDWEVPISFLEIYLTQTLGYSFMKMKDMQ